MNYKFLLFIIACFCNCACLNSMQNDEQEIIYQKNRNSFIDQEIQSKESGLNKLPSLKEIIYRLILKTLFTNFKDQSDYRSWFNIQKTELVKELANELVDRLRDFFSYDKLQSLLYENDEIKGLELKDLSLINKGFFLLHDIDQEDSELKLCDLNCNIVKSNKLSFTSEISKKNFVENIISDLKEKDKIVDCEFGLSKSRLLVIKDISENKSVMQIYDLDNFNCLNEFEFCRCTVPVSLKVSNNKTFFVVPACWPNSTKKNKNFNSLYIVDAFSGKILRHYNSYNLDILRIQENINFNCYDISPNDCYILMASNSGYIVKINLKLEPKNLADILEEIKNHMQPNFCKFYVCPKQNRETESSCLVS